MSVYDKVNTVSINYPQKFQFIPMESFQLWIFPEFCHPTFDWLFLVLEEIIELGGHSEQMLLYQTGHKKGGEGSWLLVYLIKMGTRAPLILLAVFTILLVLFVSLAATEQGGQFVG